jgi:hypothetical protein
MADVETAPGPATLVLDAPQGTEHAHTFGHPKVAAKLVEFLTASQPQPPDADA